MWYGKPRKPESQESRYIELQLLRASPPWTQALTYLLQSYPAGVTTNSASGVIDYESFYPVFETMEAEGLVLNLHGEVPSNDKEHVTVLNAEERFLPTLKELHRRSVKPHCVMASSVSSPG
jgi:dihydroorotase